MKSLTKDDLIISLNNEYDVDNGLLIQGDKEHSEEVAQQILKNQEDAESWNFYGSLAAGIKSDEIVAHLKKRIEHYKETDNEMMVEELQKIMGEKT